MIEMDDSPWLLPDWPAPAGVHALCSTRRGGVSSGALESLNLGARVGDDPLHVEANRRILRDRIGARPLFLDQVHGVGLARLDARSQDGIAADACTTVERGLACTVMVADCLPVLFTDAAGRRVAAAHAGWRGLAAGVLEQTVQAFQSEDEGEGEGGAARVIAWLGPCIGPDAFEVGDEVLAAFEAISPAARECFRPGARPGKWLADLAGLARQRLRAAGVGRLHGNDSSEAWCTVNNPLRFFSHRRDGVSGRFAACIWRA